MRNLKFITGFTLSGFVLSLFCGIFSHSTFLHVFLQALLFAIIFALLAIVISLLFDKFLNDGSAGTESDSGITPESSVYVPQKGSKVDFVIQDEELPVSESENQFFVGDKHQLLNESDIKKSSAESSFQSQGNQGFVPLQRESFENLSEKEAKSIESSNSGIQFSSVSNNNGANDKNIKTSAINTASGEKNTSNESENGSNGEIDSLPDMNEVTFSSEGDGDSEAEPQQTSLASSSRSSSGVSKGVDTKDASLMAKAISSILSGES